MQRIHRLAAKAGGWAWHFDKRYYCTTEIWAMPSAFSSALAAEY